ncbi:MAG TPA: hypothetical protein VIO64_09020 [Pseudobacteroides sp.]|uniref:O-antigen ligase family protein n=1 Tax=Pseudobacteroides sp. TaxID=1968840 RepID=UPI002F946FFA
MIISKLSSKLFFVCLGLFLALFRVYLIPYTTFKALSFMILLVYLFLFGHNKKVLYHSRYALLLAGIIFFTTVYASRNLVGLFNGSLYGLQFFVVFLFTNHMVYKYGIRQCIKNYLQCSLLLTALMDISVLLNMDLDPSHYQNLITYLFGNKFMVAYLHMITLGFLGAYWYIEKNKISLNHKIGYIVYGIFSIFMSGYAKCSTGVIGNFVVLILVIMPLNIKIKDFFRKPGNMFIILLIGNAMLLGGGLILEIPGVKYLIVNILHEDLTLTGRFWIYGQLRDVISSNLWFGHGYNSDTMTKLIGYGNAQNGILQYVLDCGVIGVFIFLLNWFHCLKTAKNTGHIVWPIYGLIYAFIISSLVEVSFKIPFLMALSLLLSIGVSTTEYKSNINMEIREKHSMG